MTSLEGKCFRKCIGLSTNQDTDVCFSNCMSQFAHSTVDKIEPYDHSYKGGNGNTFKLLLMILIAFLVLLWLLRF